MGRWKMGPNGGYWDAQDSGPDQYTPTPAEQAQVNPPPAAAPAGAPDMGPGGMTRRPPVWSERFPDGNGGYYNPSGHFDKDGNPVAPVPTPTDTGGMKGLPEWWPKKGPINIEYGDGGSWNVGGGSAPATPIKDLLAMLRQHYGGSMPGQDPNMAQPLGAAGAQPSGVGGLVSSAVNGGQLGSAVKPVRNMIGSAIGALQSRPLTGPLSTLFGGK